MVKESTLPTQADAVFAAPDTVPACFAAQARATPDATALEHGPTRFSYRELDEQSNRLARFLQSLGVGRETPVALCAGRSADWVIAQLAILKCGGACLPLDAAYPAERLALMLADAAPPVLLTHAGVELPLPKHHAIRVVRMDLDRAAIAAFAAEPFHSEVSPDQLAGIIYTSGSTGRPKGAEILHRGITRLVRDQDYAPFGPGERVLLLASPSFDGILFELWGPLLNGGVCVIFGDHWVEPVRLEAVIREHRVGGMLLTTGFFHQIIDQRPETLAAARWVIAGGEALSPDHAEKARRLLPGLRLINGYGPTECTTFACAYDVAAREAWGCASVPIGTPLRRTSAVVVDEQLAPVPPGQAGELLLGGPGLARGYRGDPALTARKFVSHPLAPGPDGRLYRTGDLCRVLPGGRIEYLGRIDNQLKIRGFRVEPGEVETALRALPGVRDAAALARELGNSRQLVACVTPAPGVALESADLRAALALRLPEHLVPVLVKVVPGFPLTRNGKVDRRRLLEENFAGPVSGPSASPDSSSPSDTPTDRLLALWRDVLRQPDLGPDDDFFVSGGDSLLAVQLSVDVERALGRPLPLGLLHRHPSPSALAAHWAEPSAAPAALAPVFVIPGTSGIGRCPTELADRLAPARRCHDELRYPGLMDNRPPLETIEAIAAEMVRQIQVIHPSGPCCLAGHSFAGLVAYETARQLSAAGRRVEKVVLWDAIPPDLDTPRAPREVLGVFGFSLARVLRLSSGRPRERPFHDMQRRVRVAVRRRFPDWLRKLRPVPAVFRIREASERALAGYRPGAYAGDVVLIRCAAPHVEAFRRIRQTPHHDWDRYVAPGRLLTHELPCTHGELMQPPMLGRLVELTSAALGHS